MKWRVFFIVLTTGLLLYFFYRLNIWVNHQDLNMVWLNDITDKGKVIDKAGWAILYFTWPFLLIGAAVGCITGAWTGGIVSVLFASWDLKPQKEELKKQEDFFNQSKIDLEKNYIRKQELFQQKKIELEQDITRMENQNEKLYDQAERYKKNYTAMQQYQKENVAKMKKAFEERKFAKKKAKALKKQLLALKRK